MTVIRFNESSITLQNLLYREMPLNNFLHSQLRVINRSLGKFTYRQGRIYVKQTDKKILLNQGPATDADKSLVDRNWQVSGRITVRNYNISINTI